MTAKFKIIDSGKEEINMKNPEIIIGLVAVPQKATQITKVIVDEARRNVIVKFSDGKTEVVHCDEEDVFDVYVGVALAEARHKYGSTSKFRKHVDSLAVVVNKPKVTTKKAKKKGSK